MSAWLLNHHHWRKSQDSPIALHNKVCGGIWILLVYAADRCWLLAKAWSFYTKVNDLLLHVYVCFHLPLSQCSVLAEVEAEAARFGWKRKRKRKQLYKKFGWMRKRKRIFFLLEVEAEAFQFFLKGESGSRSCWKFLKISLCISCLSGSFLCFKLFL